MEQVEKMIGKGGFVGNREIAQYLGIKESTVYAWVHTRKIPYYKIGRLVKFRLSEIESWLEGVKVGTFET